MKTIPMSVAVSIIEMDAEVMDSKHELNIDVATGTGALAAEVTDDRPELYPEISRDRGEWPDYYNGSYDVTPTEQDQLLDTEGLLARSDITVRKIPTGYIVPTGTKDITVTANSEFTEDVTSFENAHVTVDVPIPPEYVIPTGTKGVQITENGDTTEDIAGYANVAINVNVPVPPGYVIPEGTKDIEITENGQTTTDVSGYANASVSVNVPVPPGYVIPTGTKEVSITQNGTTTQNVSGFESAEIAVNVPVPPGYVIPTGTKNVSITGNGTTTENVSGYENAEITVNVPIPPGYIVPTGVKTINVSGNGSVTEDVTQYASAVINVAVPFPETQSKTVTPTESEQTVLPDSGKVLGSVTVNPIPSEYADVSGVTAQAVDVYAGKSFVDANGNTVNGSYVYNWMGEEVEFVKKVYDEVFTLDDTTFPSWEPSNTAKAIKTSVNADKLVFDMVNYDYLLVWHVRFDAAYVDGATLMNIPYRECAVIYQAVQRNPNSVANIEAKNFNGNRCATLYTTPLNVYYNASGNRAYTYSVSYGIYGSATAATFSSSTAASPTVTIKTPAINARCHDTYFATTRAAELDTENSTIRIVGEVYRTKVGATLRSMYTELIDLFDETYE